MVTDSCFVHRMLVDDLLFDHCRAEHIMAMPAAQRRWAAQEVRQLIAESPLQTPRYELVDGELLVTPSPSFAHPDRVVKRPEYQRHLPKYWIVDLDSRLFERWRPNDERPEILVELLAWHSCCPAGAVVP